MPYPICSVVAVFKMLIRILNTATTEQMGYGMVSFFCVLASKGMNVIAFGKGRGRSQKTPAYSKGIFHSLWSQQTENKNNKPEEM